MLPRRRVQVGALSERDVRTFVDDVGLSRHAPAFAEHRVDGECFLEITEAEFVDDLKLSPPDAAFFRSAL